jgi:hypothetical protein
MVPIEARVVPYGMLIVSGENPRKFACDVHSIAQRRGSGVAAYSPFFRSLWMRSKNAGRAMTAAVRHATSPITATRPK